jgi:hypothetical protein
MNDVVQITDITNPAPGQLAAEQQSEAGGNGDKAVALYHSLSRQHRREPRCPTRRVTVQREIPI